MMGGTISKMTLVSAWSTRRLALMSVCWILIASALPVVDGQDNANTEELKPRSESLSVKDDPRIHIAMTYWPSGVKQDASVVVLLHGLNGNQLDWGALPKQLHDDGYAVITVDLRGHGQSKGTSDEPEKSSKNKAKTPKTGKAAVDAASLRARDYEAMVAFDMEAVKQFIFAEHQARRLNMNKMAIIGAGMGAAVGVRYAALDWLKKPHSDGPVGNQTPRGQDVRALVLLTPETEIIGLSLPDAIKTLRTPLFGVAMMFAVGKKDKADKGQTKKLYDQAASLENTEKNPQRMYLLDDYNTPTKGTAMLGKGLPVELNIMNFLKKHLQEVRSEWRDRESRVGKKKSSD